ncbi:hypothetical protein JKP88DRAFT_233545 [Tribonema minus]|uniref:Uncharacterized protein n=1 Tax=Tribonema minus TaxID=303371 RepID=A0A835ZBN2_9STRA|nr:hypothetical protein JKP88DRAFT_233545 [Tribonema minus]
MSGPTPQPSTANPTPQPTVFCPTSTPTTPLACTVLISGVSYTGNCYVRNQQPLNQNLVGGGVGSCTSFLPNCDQLCYIPNDAAGLCGDNTCSSKGYKCRCYLKSTTGASCKPGDLIGVNPASTVDQGGGCQENRCNAITTAVGAGCCPTSPCARRTLLAELLADKDTIEW